MALALEKLHIHIKYIICSEFPQCPLRPAQALFWVLLGEGNGYCLVLGIKPEALRSTNLKSNHRFQAISLKNSTLGHYEHVIL